MSELIICSSPINDNLYGNNYCNIIEHDWDSIIQRLESPNAYRFVHNSDNYEDLLRLHTFANIYNLTLLIETPETIYIPKSTKNLLNDKQILYVGCSHTLGEGQNNHEVFTEYLSKKLKLQPVIDGHSNKGNWLSEEKLFHYDLHEQNVCIQFTETSRIRLNGEDYRLTEGDKEINNVFTDERLTAYFISQVQRIVKLLRLQKTNFIFFHLHKDWKYRTQVEEYFTRFKEYCYLGDYVIDFVEDGHFGPLTNKNIANKLYKKFSNLYL